MIPFVNFVITSLTQFATFSVFVFKIHTYYMKSLHLKLLSTSLVMAGIMGATAQDRKPGGPQTPQLELPRDNPVEMVAISPQHLQPKAQNLTKK